MEFDNQYLEYDEYVELGGTLAETPFNILEAEAQLNIDNYTYGRLKDLDEQVNEVKLCIYNLISTLQSYAESNLKARNVSSENTDGYSVSYVGMSRELTDAQSYEIKKIIKTYLSQCKLEDGTPYMYCGVD